MDQQTEQRLLNLADSLPQIEVRVPAVPEPEPEPVPEPGKLFGPTADVIPVVVPVPPVEPEPEPAAAETVHDQPPGSPWFTPPPEWLTQLAHPPEPYAAAPPRGRTRHVNRRQRRRLRLFLLGCLLIVLAAAGVMTEQALRAPETGRAAGPSPTAPHTSPAPASAHRPSGSLADVPGVPAPFAACVAFTASGNGTRSRNIYGITPASGYDVAGYSVARQKTVFTALYQKYGAAPWVSFGCTV